MHTLYLASRPFMVIMSVALRRIIDEAEIADIMLSQMNIDSRLELGEKLEDCGVFDNAFQYEYDSSNVKQVFWESITDKQARCLFKKTKYDAVYICMSCYADDRENNIINYLRKFNPNLKIYGYVEGYSSYTERFFTAWDKKSRLHKITNELLRISKKREIIKCFDGIFAFHPELFSREIHWPIYCLQDGFLENEDKIKMDLKRIFEYDMDKYQISEKYVFFEECFSEERGEDVDLDVVEEIAKIVGKDNIMIKRHPINKKNRFGKLGYKTIDTTKVPWEIYSLDSSQPQHILLSFSSGALINSNFLTHSRHKAILLYKAFPDLRFGDVQYESTRVWFEKVANIYNDKIYAPESKKRLQELLEHI